MKKVTCLINCLAVLVLAVSAQTDAEMKAWHDYMTPGEVHKMLAQADGEWNEEITMWMDPNAAPVTTTATCRNEMIMGGRYQLSKSTGMMMGMPFEGMSLTGYDNAKKTFTSTWVDNFGTGTTTMEGKWDDQARSITFTGKGIDPMSGKDTPMRQVFRFIDKDTQEIEMYDSRNGNEVKTMFIHFTRKK